MVKIKFFATIKQKIGREFAEINIIEPTSISDIIKKLEADIPELSQSIADTRSLVAVNHEFAKMDTLAKNGDEIAFIPPMSGGDNELIRIQTDDFSVEKETERIKNVSTKIGGIVTFLGTAREFSRGKKINELEFEHYPVMAERKLAEIRAKALDDYDVIELSIIHRVGNIAIGDNIVLIVVGAEHRADAFKACEWAIDELKQITPIWKKELTDTGESWVEEHP